MRVWLCLPVPSVGISSFAGALCTLFSEVWLRGSMAVTLLWIVEVGRGKVCEVDSSRRQQHQLERRTEEGYAVVKEEEKW